jgi:hypothetical protein
VRLRKANSNSNTALRWQRTRQPGQVLPLTRGSIGNRADRALPGQGLGQVRANEIRTTGYEILAKVRLEIQHPLHPPAPLIISSIQILAGFAGVPSVDPPRLAICWFLGLSV